MRIYTPGWLTVCAAVAGANFLPNLGRQAFGENLPPSVSLLWPTGGVVFGFPQFVKFQAAASDPDGSITQVQFFADKLAWRGY